MHEAHLEGNICIVVHAKYLWVVRERQAVHVMPVLLDGVLFRCIVETCMGPVAVWVCVWGGEDCECYTTLCTRRWCSMGSVLSVAMLCLGSQLKNTFEHA